MYGTVRGTQYGYSLWEFQVYSSTGNATQNFWRSAENLAINPSAGNDRWAVAQAGPRSAGSTCTAAWSPTRPPG
jgi:hypothetical protein